MSTPTTSTATTPGRAVIEIDPATGTVVVNDKEIEHDGTIELELVACHAAARMMAAAGFGDTPFRAFATRVGEQGGVVLIVNPDGSAYAEGTDREALAPLAAATGESAPVATEPRVRARRSPQAFIPPLTGRARMMGAGAAAVVLAGGLVAWVSAQEPPAPAPKASNSSGITSPTPTPSPSLPPVASGIRVLAHSGVAQRPGVVVVLMRASQDQRVKLTVDPAGTPRPLSRPVDLRGGQWQRVVMEGVGAGKAQWFVTAPQIPLLNGTFNVTAPVVASPTPVTPSTPRPKHHKPWRPKHPYDPTGRQSR